MAVLRYTVRYLLGPICVGSLGVAVAAVLRVVLLLASKLLDAVDSRRQHQMPAVSVSWWDHFFNMLASVLMAVVSLLKWSLQYFNKHVFVHVAMYSHSYRQSIRDAATTIGFAGLDDYLNDQNTTTSVLASIKMLGAGFVGIANLICKSAFNRIFGYTNGGVRFGTIFGGFMLGYVVTAVSATVVESAVITLLICFSEAPQELMKTNPALYSVLQDGLSSIEEDAGGHYLRTHDEDY
eukprot:Filipodium_phascolosomae@DN6076_c0_g1_i1.p1